MREDIKLVIGNPTADARVYNLYPHLVASQNIRTYNIEVCNSILAFAFNQLWVKALNLREEGNITHFLLWHADIRPRHEHWLDTMLEEMERTEVDVLSAISPIKDTRGLTSTALDTNYWAPLRLTTKQVSELPETWTTDGLLLNTGLMLVDFRKDWVKQVCFHMNDALIQREDGRWLAVCEPEDWNFSRQCHKLGLKIAVTRKVVLDHFGVNIWPSDSVWGKPHDECNGQFANPEGEDLQVELETL